MEVIKVHHPLDPALVPPGPVVVAMGFLMASIGVTSKF